jgi:potassium efflux system protein
MLTPSCLVDDRDPAAAMLRRMLGVLMLLAGPLGAAAPATANETLAADAVVPVPLSTSPGPPAGSGPIEAEGAGESFDGTVTPAMVELRRSELQEASGVAEEVRSRAAEEYARALERLGDTAKVVAQTASLRAETASIPQELAKLQALAAEPPDPAAGTAVSPDADSWDGDRLRAAHSAAEANLEEQRARKASLLAEEERRTLRSRELPELLAQSRGKFEELSRSLASPPAAGDPTEYTAARRLRLQTSLQYRAREQELLQQEAKTYTEAARLMALRVDLAERAVQAAQRQAAALGALLSDRERRDAERQAAEARRATIHAHPAVQEAARINSLLAETNAHLVESAEVARGRLAAAEKQRDELAARHADTRRRAEEARYSQAVAMMLRSQRAELPDIREYRRRATSGAAEQAELNFKLLEWETERRRIRAVDEIVAEAVDAVRLQMADDELREVRDELVQVFTARQRLYAELTANARNQLARLAALQTAEQGVVRAVTDQAAFISEHILWVRSTAPISAALLSPLVGAVGELADGTAWRRVWHDLVSDARARPLYELLVLPPIWLIALRRRLVARLAELADDARRSSVTGMAPTLRAVLVTAALAVPVPALLALGGWRMTAVGTPGDYTHSLGRAALLGAGMLAVVNFLRASCQTNGLGTAHFGWDSAVTAAIRSALGWVRATSLPAGVVCGFTEFTGDELLTSTVGRLALMIESVATSLISYQLLRPSGAVAAMIARELPRSWLHGGYRAWTSVLVAAPLGFAVASAVGWHYTATRLATRLVATWVAIAVLVGLRELGMRWLQVVYRRLAARRSRERRAELQARQTGGGGDAGGEPLVATEAGLEVKLTDVNRQSQQVIRIGVALLGIVLLAVVWREVVPAIGYLDKFELWSDGTLPAGERGEGPRITLFDLLTAVAWATATVLACRNLPGLLDLAAFQRLPLDAGGRYAAGALTKYLIAVIGVVGGFRQIGVGWQSVQWLVAAMTVGLGFGLQEIFANFVSGIILLFERPVRVGDVVTIGDISGTVTRIRIRATTVLDWDHKELIVPNRDFVTGKLVNWTLTNPNLRVVIRVGIAYGSDTRLASRLLEEAAAANPLALTDPPPVAMFQQFGASSLDFELRVFAGGPSNARVLRHELHLAIDDAFRAHGIEIAFPRQDLHVRSMPEPAAIASIESMASRGGGALPDDDAARGRAA